MEVCGSFLVDDGVAGVLVPGRKTSRSSAFTSGGCHCSEKTTRRAEWSTITGWEDPGAEPASVECLRAPSEAVFPFSRATSVSAKLSNIVEAFTSMYETPEVSK